MIDAFLGCIVVIILSLAFFHLVSGKWYLASGK